MYVMGNPVSDFTVTFLCTALGMYDVAAANLPHLLCLDLITRQASKAHTVDVTCIHMRVVQHCECSSGIWRLTFFHELIDFVLEELINNSFIYSFSTESSYSTY